MLTLVVEPVRTTLGDLLATPHRGLSLAWLGQAGFVIRHDDAVLLVDPYLSDSLALKYRFGRFPHERLMPSPIAPDAFPRLDLVLVTHRHSDHMDPGTLPILAERYPTCRFVVPAAEEGRATFLGLPPDRLTGAVAGMPVLPLPDVVVLPVAAAHERRERDANGRDYFLGYGLRLSGTTLYHSGDCIPHAGLVDAVRGLDAALALLPVNGRDAERASAGIPGNFTLAEAVDLCREAGIPSMIAHHWGLFGFNTIDPAEIDAVAAASTAPQVLRPSTGEVYRLR